jgi:hypothetical protein
MVRLLVVTLDCPGLIYHAIFQCWGIFPEIHVISKTLDGPSVAISFSFTNSFNLQNAFLILLRISISQAMAVVHRYTRMPVKPVIHLNC